MKKIDILLINKIKKNLKKKIKKNFNLIILEKTISTIKDIIFLKQYANIKNIIIIANKQKKANGQFKKKFFTKTNHGIYISILTNFKKIINKINNIKYFNILILNSIIKTIFKFSKHKMNFKLPNDIYFKKKKVAGILITIFKKKKIENISINIGINFSIKKKFFPKNIKNKSTSIFLKKTKVTRNIFISNLLNNILLNNNFF